MPISDFVKKIISYKYLLAVIIIALILLAYYYKKRETLKPTKKKRNRPVKKSKTRERLRKNKEDSSSEDEVDMTPKELYKQIHIDMLNGMSSDEFSKASDINNKALYIELRQLYNSAKDENREVTSSDYSKIFTKLDIN